MQPQLDGPQVLVATRALPVGTIIGPDSFRFQPWPKELVEQAYFLKGETDPASLAGTVVRNTITAGQPITQGRSEEHTSELQSLMRISYAVFCLKKKTITSLVTIIRHNRHSTIPHTNKFK